MLSITGCGEKRQIVKKEVVYVDKIVQKEIDKELTKPCPIYYSKKKHTVKKDIENALKIQRLIIKNDCNVRFKAIEN